MATVVGLPEEATDAIRIVNGGVVTATPDLGAKIIVRLTSAPLGSFGEPRLDQAVARDALEALTTERNTYRTYDASGESTVSGISVFIEAYPAPRRMVIFGSTDFTGALVRAAKLLNYRVTVCDARQVFTTVLRFPEADEVIVDWPHSYLEKVGDQLGPGDAVCVLSHDNKYDLPAIVKALTTRVGYLGAMGSRRTTLERNERLRHEGVDDAGLARIMSPIGLDIGARSPEETSIAILAEIIALRESVAAAFLRDQTGPIHRSVQ
jgi:xanthine dehydrogenase accessory factor